MEEPDIAPSIKTRVDLTLQEPLVVALLENSSLTRTQLESLLLDVLPENLGFHKISFSQKAQLRLKASISRGSFNRSLRQARTNVIRAVYTVLLLEYLGLVSQNALARYLEVSNELRSYADSYAETWRTSPGECEKLLSTLRTRLAESLKALAAPVSLKNSV